jgi:hypothetical protein
MNRIEAQASSVFFRHKHRNGCLRKKGEAAEEKGRVSGPFSLGRMQKMLRTVTFCGALSGIRIRRNDNYAMNVRCKTQVHGIFDVTRRFRRLAGTLPQTKE